MSIYYCPKCNSIQHRDSVKKWIKSYCEETGKETRLIKIDADYYCGNHNSCDGKTLIAFKQFCQSNSTVHIGCHERIKITSKN